MVCDSVSHADHTSTPPNLPRHPACNCLCQLTRCHTTTGITSLTFPLCGWHCLLHAAATATGTGGRAKRAGNVVLLLVCATQQAPAEMGLWTKHVGSTCMMWMEQLLCVRLESSLTLNARQRHHHQSQGSATERVSAHLECCEGLQQAA